MSIVNSRFLAAVRLLFLNLRTWLRLLPGRIGRQTKRLSRQVRRIRIRRIGELILGIVLPLFGLGFVVSDRLGVFDEWLGHTEVLNIANRFETSYEPGIDRQVRADEDGWRPLLRLIRRYSSATLPDNEEPIVFARAVAIVSGKIEIGDSRAAEWTSPSTPTLLIFQEWPGSMVPKDKYLIVGTIGDLRKWVEDSRRDLRFVFQDVFLSIVAVSFGALLLAQKKP
jgi:hypothetical protein